MPIRVVQLATGQTGLHGLRGIIDHPDLELVGVVVHDPAKAGRDAGELCGRGAVGVITTTDRAQALSTNPDCVAGFESWGDGSRADQLISEAAELLRAGIDVVSVSVPTFVYPHSSTNDPAQVTLLEQACRDGHSSFFTTGVDPGYATDVLPLMLTMVSARIDQIVMSEIYDYSTYDDAEGLFRYHGFGTPLATVPPYLSPSGSFVPIRTGILEMLAAGLGFHLDGFRFEYERAPAPATYRYRAGTIEAGTAAGHRLRLQGLVDGRPVLVAEHITRMHADVAPEWPQPSAGIGSYRVVVEGSPRYEVDLSFTGEDGSAMSAGLALTALRAVNAIPAVHASASGLLSALDLLSVTGRGRVFLSQPT